MRFFSPPEKPKLTARFKSSGLTPTSFAFSRISFMKAAALISSSPRALRSAFSAVRRKYMLATPGISIGYWKARNRPMAARSSGSSSRSSAPS